MCTQVCGGLSRCARFRMNSLTTLNAHTPHTPRHISPLTSYTPLHMHPSILKMIYRPVRWAPISMLTLVMLLVTACWSFVLGLALPESGTPLFMMYVCACIATLQWSLPDLSARFLEKASTTQPSAATSKLAVTVCDSTGQTFLHFPLCVGSAAGALTAMVYLSGRGTLYLLTALLTARLSTYLLRTKLDPLHTSALGFSSSTRSGRYVSRMLLPAGAFLLWFFGIAALESALGGLSVGELVWGTIVFLLKLLGALALLTLPAVGYESGEEWRRAERSGMGKDCVMERGDCCWGWCKPARYRGVFVRAVPYLLSACRSRSPLLFFFFFPAETHLCVAGLLADTVDLLHCLASAPLMRE
jgi:hypothetical protein